MKIATWNVNSILARLPHVTRWLEAEQPDVLCVQETKCTDDKFPSLELKALGYDCVIFGQQSYNGVAIISKAGCASQTFSAAIRMTILPARRACFQPTSPAFASSTSTFPTARWLARKNISSNWNG